MRTIGSNGPTVSDIGLGCMGMSQSYGTPDDEESIRTVHRALELGVTFFDTADTYGGGANERLVARALGERRKDVVLATKCGIVPGTGGARVGVDGSPAHIRAACAASLDRLGTDVIDLYYLHRVDRAIPIEESVGAMADLVREGKVRFIGLSEVSPATIRRAHRVHPIRAVQSEYSLWFREPEAMVLPACRELGIGFVAFSPLGRGFLSGNITGIDGLPADDLRRRVPRFMGEHLGKNIALVTTFSRIASRKRCTPAQLALAWLLAKGDDIVPIPGTKRRPYLEDNVAAIRITLTQAEVEELDALFTPEAVSGDRYPDDMARLVDRVGG
jgi:aryl-alcohol dehydrogenase-like predicted oxidoreductase